VSTRKRQTLNDLNGANDRPWDLLVIGGGITGAGILHEAARLGFRALLIEQRDYCWGTSSRSSKLVHGGLRYLASGQLHLTREALAERERLLAEAPGLVERLDFCFPLYRGVFPPRIAAAALFWLYDRLAGIRDHDWLTLPALRTLFPGLDPAGMTGAYRYTDAVTDDARLVLRVLSEAVALGATARNYTRATRLLRDDSRVRGAELRDEESGEVGTVAARVVVNATGAWADRLGGRPPPGLSIRPQRGSHLVLDAAGFPAPCAIFLRHPRDGRRVFVYPWEGRTIVGTTDLPHTPDLDDAARITAAEVDYLLEVTDLVFTRRRPRAADVIATWSGVRPIIAPGAATDPSKASREHQVWSEPGLVSCSGGKLTTFLEMAQDVMRAARAELPDAASPGPARLLQPATLAADALPGVAAAQAERLLALFGDAAVEVVAGATAEELQALSGPGPGTCLAELRWSLRHEAVIHLDDLLLRRSRLGLLQRNGAAAILDRVRPLCMEALGWDTAGWERERDRYQRIIRDDYALPSAGSA